MRVFFCLIDCQKKYRWDFKVGTHRGTLRSLLRETYSLIELALKPGEVHTRQTPLQWRAKTPSFALYTDAFGTLVKQKRKSTRDGSCYNDGHGFGASRVKNVLNNPLQARSLLRVRSHDSVFSRYRIFSRFSDFRLGCSDSMIILPCAVHNPTYTYTPVA